MRQRSARKGRAAGRTSTPPRRAGPSEGGRGALGRGARRARVGAAGGARRVGHARRPAGPGRHPREAERDAGARARADPARADDRLAVHVLSRERGDHGVRICRAPRRRGCVCSAAAMRTCRTSACSRRRIAGSSSISTTSTRRCRRRSSGTSSAWSASFVVAARGNGHRRKEQRAAARAAAAAYRTTMATAATMRFLDVWYTRFDADKVLAELAPKAKQGRDQGRSEGSRQGADADEPRLAGEVRAAGRRRLPDQAAAAGDRAPARDDARRLRADHPPGTRRLRALAGPRSARRARPLPLRGLRAQGRRRRLGRDRGDDGPADGRPRGRSAVPAAQGGEHVGARPVCGRQRVRAPGRAGGARPAAHAGRERRVPRLDHRDRRAPARVLCPPAARHEGLGRRRDDAAGAPGASTASSAAPPWRARTRAPATRRRSPATSATTTRSTVRSSASPSPTPTRTTPTTRRSPAPRRTTHRGRARRPAEQPPGVPAAASWRAGVRGLRDRAHLRRVVLAQRIVGVGLHLRAARDLVGHRVGAGLDLDDVRGPRLPRREASERLGRPGARALLDALLLALLLALLEPCLLALEPPLGLALLRALALPAAKPCW